MTTDPQIRRAQDTVLALRCQLGEPAAFADLVEEMERPLLYYVTKLLHDESQAFDVLQEVWLKAFRQIRRLETTSSLRAWLYRIAYGLAIDRLRHERSRQRVEQVAAELCPDAEEPAGFDQEDANAIHEALDSLELHHREALVLFFLEELSIPEIAAVLACPEGTVKSRIFYAKRALREILLRGGYGTRH